MQQGSCPTAPCARGRFIMRRMNQLDALKQWTTVVADTGDFRQLAQFKPQDATTNPSLILKAVQKPEYAPLLKETVTRYRGKPLDEIDRPPAGALRHRDPVDHPGPRLHRGRCAPELRHRTPPSRAPSASSRCTRPKASTRERVLIKVASTWEGIQAAAQLRAAGHPHQPHAAVLLRQAVACGAGQGAADLALRRPHLRLVQEERRQQVGRGRQRRRQRSRACSRCAQIYDYYKHYGIATEVMGASFRNTGQIARAGRLRPADHQPRAAGATGRQRRRRCSARSTRRRRKACDMRAGAATTRPASATR